MLGNNLRGKQRGMNRTGLAPGWDEQKSAGELGPGKEKLAFCMSWVIASKTDGNRHRTQYKPGCHQRRGRGQMSLRSSAGPILGKRKGS